MKFLCDAIPFCYGPGSALLVLLEELFLQVPEFLEVDILATGSTAEFLQGIKIPAELLAIDSEDPFAVAIVDTSRYNTFLNICNPTSYQAFRDRDIPIIFVDFLLWMHKGPVAPHFGADLYLAENYPGLDHWLAQRRDEIPHLYIIPPLVKRPTQSSRKPGTLLVCYGGLYSRLTKPGDNTNYPFFMTKIILNALAGNRRFDHVLFTGGARAMALLANEFRNAPETSFQQLSHEQFLKEVAQCEVFLTHPGLYAPFEAMQCGAPTIFLPPSNYTQLLQLQNFRAAGLAPISYSWDDCFPDLIPDNLPEPEGVARILDQIRRAELNPRIHEDIINTISCGLYLKGNGLAAMGKAQQQCTLAFGSNGPKIAASVIRAWILDKGIIK